MKNLIVLAFAFFSLSLSAQDNSQTPDVYLQDIIDSYAHSIIESRDEIGPVITFQGGVLVTKVLYMMRDNYLDLYGITGAEDIGNGFGDPYGFVDSNGNEGTFVIFNTPNEFDNIEMTLVLDRQ